MGPTPPPVTPGFGPMGDMVLNIGTIVFLVGATIELAFLIHYVVVAPAFKSWIGVMFVLRSISFLLAGLAIVLGRVLGPNYAGRPIVTLVLFSAVLLSAITTYGTFLYERYRRNDGEDRPLRPMLRGIVHGFRARHVEDVAREEYDSPQRPMTGPLSILGENS